jgi:thiol-disulfide isomerase/thioredoxin
MEGRDGQRTGWLGGPAVRLACLLLVAAALNGTALASEPSYDFSLTELVSGEVLTLPGLTDDRPLVVHVWGPDCPHCRVQMPYAAALYDRLDLDEVNYFTLSLSGTEDEIDEYLDEHELTFPVLWGESGEYGSGFEEEGWPTTFVFAPGGEMIGWCDICGPAYLTEMLDLIAEAGGPPVRSPLFDRGTSRSS